jgi:hypothetical protein
MGLLYGILFFAIYAALLMYPLFGVIQVIDGIRLYFLKGKESEHYRKFGNYLKMVILYFIGVAILIGTPLGEWLLHYVKPFPFIYTFIIPIPIAIHKWKISRNVHRGNSETEILDEHLVC